MSCCQSLSIGIFDVAVSVVDETCEKLFDEEDGGGLGIERIGVDDNDVFGFFSENFEMLVGVAGVEDEQINLFDVLVFLCVFLRFTLYRKSVDRFSNGL